MHLIDSRYWNSFWHSLTLVILEATNNTIRNATCMDLFNHEDFHIIRMHACLKPMCCPVQGKERNAIRLSMTLSSSGLKLFLSH